MIFMCEEIFCHRLKSYEQGTTRFTGIYDNYILNVIYHKGSEYLLRRNISSLVWFSAYILWRELGVSLQLHL